MNEPLNPYELYELTGMTEQERKELDRKEADYWDNFPEWEGDE